MQHTRVRHIIMLGVCGLLLLTGSCSWSKAFNSCRAYCPLLVVGAWTMV
jgi:hypothetical protein